MLDGPGLSRIGHGHREEARSRIFGTEITDAQCGSRKFHSPDQVRSAECTNAYVFARSLTVCAIIDVSSLSESDHFSE